MPICCSGCARAAYLFALVLQLVLGLRPGRRHMRLFSNAGPPGCVQVRGGLKPLSSRRRH
jgi:hypothetical protein